MDDPRWLRLITIGLVLAALAVGYFLLTGGLSSSSSKQAQNLNSKVGSSPVPTIIPAPSASPSVLGQNVIQSSPSPIPVGGVTTLPRTGFPIILIGTISAGVMIAGWGLRRFPH